MHRSESQMLKNKAGMRGWRDNEPFVVIQWHEAPASERKERGWSIHRCKQRIICLYLVHSIVRVYMYSPLVSFSLDQGHEQLGSQKLRELSTSMASPLSDTGLGRLSSETRYRTRQAQHRSRYLNLYRRIFLMLFSYLVRPCHTETTRIQLLLVSHHDSSSQVTMVPIL